MNGCRIKTHNRRKKSHRRIPNVRFVFIPPKNPHTLSAVWWSGGGFWLHQRDTFAVRVPSAIIFFWLLSVASSSSSFLVEKNMLDAGIIHKNVKGWENIRARVSIPHALQYCPENWRKNNGSLFLCATHSSTTITTTPRTHTHKKRKKVTAAHLYSVSFSRSGKL